MVVDSKNPVRPKEFLESRKSVNEYKSPGARYNSRLITLSKVRLLPAIITFLICTLLPGEIR